MKSHSSSFRMTPPGRTSRGFGQIRLDPPLPPAPPPIGGGVGNLFNSSWDRGVVGCSPASIEDGTIWFQDGDPRNDTLWDEAGGIDCTGHGGLPATEITTDFAIDGAQCFRIWQLPGFFNGTDCRVVKNITNQLVPVYFRWYIRWGNNWQWCSSDHKMCICGGGGNQEIYMNVRADFTNGYNPNAARLAVHNNPFECVWTDNRVSRLMVKNTWYCIEFKITPGLHGRIDARINGVDAVFTPDGSGQFGQLNILDMPVCQTGPGINFFKMDSTYNVGSAIVEPMDQYWDRFSASNQDWIGA